MLGTLDVKDRQAKVLDILKKEVEHVKLQARRAHGAARWLERGRRVERPAHHRGREDREEPAQVGGCAALAGRGWFMSL